MPWLEDRRPAVAYTLSVAKANQLSVTVLRQRRQGVIMMCFRIRIRDLLFAFAIFAVVFAVAQPAAAQRSRGFGGPMAGELGRHGPRGDGLPDFLGLTVEQRDEWQALHERHRTETQPRFEEIRALQQKLDAALEGASPDATTVGELMLGVRDLRGKMHASHELLKDSLAAVLTPEQAIRWEAFEEAMALVRGGRGGFFGSGPDRGARGGPGGHRGPRDGQI